MVRDPSEPLPPGARLDDKYVVIRHIKTGGMGAVYEVEHGPLGKRLAAKLLLPELVQRPELLERFRREARAASATGHENIVEVTDLGETRGQVPFLVMELLHGRTLGAELKSGRLSPERAVHVTRQLLSALKAAHARGIVHRDLKPENIFLIQRAGDPDFVKVLDFGIAKMLDEVPGDELTRTGQVVGTPTYMAPEQARGAEVDRRTDLYATGAILYRMVTGERPFVGPNFNSLLFAIAQGNPKPPHELAKEISPHLEQVILRAMAVDPRARYQSAEELDEALGEEDRTLEKLAPRTAAPPKPEPSRPDWSQRSVTMMGRSRPVGKVRRAISRAMTLAIAAGMVVVLGGGTWVVVRRVWRIREEAELQREARAARARVLATTPPPVAQVTVDVEPKSAHLLLDGAEVGGPVVAVLKDGKRHILRAEADGYRAEERSFLGAADQKLVLHLRRGRSGSARHGPKGPHPIGATTPADPLEQPDPSQVKRLEKLIDKLGESTDF
ncbi:MAG TPA: serine/threonine-protein kinase [Polyangia bacterium]|jgi:serine/threonine-protein kinase